MSFNILLCDVSRCCHLRCLIRCNRHFIPLTLCASTPQYYALSRYFLRPWTDLNSLRRKLILPQGLHSTQFKMYIRDLSSVIETYAQHILELGERNKQQAKKIIQLNEDKNSLYNKLQTVEPRSRNNTHNKMIKTSDTDKHENNINQDIGLIKKQLQTLTNIVTELSNNRDFNTKRTNRTTTAQWARKDKKLAKNQKVMKFG